MISIFNNNYYTELKIRIKNLEPKSHALWGKMNINQMICHVSDQIRMATGEIKTEYIGNVFLRLIAKRLTLLGMPIPKGKVKTGTFNIEHSTLN